MDDLVTLLALSTTPATPGGTGKQSASRGASQLPNAMQRFSAVLNSLAAATPTPVAPSGNATAQILPTTTEHNVAAKPVRGAKTTQANEIQESQKVAPPPLPGGIPTGAAPNVALAAQPLQTAGTMGAGAGASAEDLSVDNPGADGADGSDVKPGPAATPASSVGIPAETLPGGHRTAPHGGGTAIASSHYATVQAAGESADEPDEDMESVDTGVATSQARVSVAPGPANGSASRPQTAIRAATERVDPGLSALVASATPQAPAAAAPAHTGTPPPVQDLSAAVPAASPAATTATTDTSGSRSSAPAPATPPPVTEQLGQACMGLQFSATSGGHISIRLNPAELGHVTVDLSRTESGGSIVNLTVERAETLRNLQASLVHLHQSLDRAGIPAEHRTVTVSLAAPDSSGSQNQGSMDGQQQQNGRQQTGARTSSFGQASQLAAGQSAGATELAPAPQTRGRFGFDITA